MSCKIHKRVTVCGALLFSLFVQFDVHANENSKEEIAVESEVVSSVGDEDILEHNIKFEFSENLGMSSDKDAYIVVSKKEESISETIDLGNITEVSDENVEKTKSVDTYLRDANIEKTSIETSYIEDKNGSIPLSKEMIDNVSADKPLDELKDIEYTSFYTPSSSERYHLVKAGDSLWGIATRYGITLNELMEYNNFSSLNVMIHPGDRLIVSIEQPVAVEPTPPNSGNNGKNDTGNESVEEHQYYTIVSGDSLWRIANKHNLSIAELVELNGFKSSNVMIHPGQRLIVGKTVVKKNGTTNGQGNSSNTTSNTTSNTNGENSGYYTISAGDSLWKIANQHGMTVDELLRLNGFSSASVMIHPGQKLKVKANATSTTPPINENTSNTEVEKQRQLLVDTAKKYLGVPYVYGGKTPSGFDCSGFVGYVYKEALGKDITTWTVTQENAGTVRGLDGLLEGDLLFWGSRGNSTHVAIYVGNSTFIHAPYEGKTVSYLNMKYYMPQFSVRVIQ